MLLAKFALINRLIEEAQNRAGEIHEREEGQGGVYIGGGTLLIIVIILLIILL
jgi:hypothetical protein